MSPEKTISPNEPTPCRLLIDPPCRGAWNMGVDEALLESAARNGCVTLRFYEWSPATLSLGYFQTTADRQQHAPSRDCATVRRFSGGGAILHDHELTYSLAVPANLAVPTTYLQDHAAKDSADLPQGAAGTVARKSAVELGQSPWLYECFHTTLIETLASFGLAATLVRSHNASGVGRCGESSQGSESRCGETSEASESSTTAPLPFLCFQRHHVGDVLLGEAKVAGSAQRRIQGAILQHGSVLLKRSDYAPVLPGIVDLAPELATILNTASLRTAWLDRLSKSLHMEFTPGELTEEEQSRAASWEEKKYGHADWTCHR